MHLFFQHLFSLIQTARLLFAEHTSLFLLCLPTLVQGSKFCPEPFPHILCGSASFKSIHAAADRDLVNLRFSFLTGPLTFLSPFDACVLCFYCLWHSYLPLPVLFPFLPFCIPPTLFTCNTSSFISHYITQHEVTFLFPGFPCCPFL